MKRHVRKVATRDATFVFLIETPVLSAHCGLDNFSTLFLVRPRCVSCFPKQAAAADWNKICTSSLSFSHPHQKRKEPCSPSYANIACAYVSFSVLAQFLSRLHFPLCVLFSRVFIAAFIQLVNDKDMCKVTGKASFFYSQACLINVEVIFFSSVF